MELSKRFELFGVGASAKDVMDTIDYNRDGALTLIEFSEGFEALRKFVIDPNTNFAAAAPEEEEGGEEEGEAEEEGANAWGDDEEGEVSDPAAEKASRSEMELYDGLAVKASSHRHALKYGPLKAAQPCELCESALEKGKAALQCRLCELFMCEDCFRAAKDLEEEEAED